MLCKSFSDNTMKTSQTHKLTVANARYISIPTGELCSLSIEDQNEDRVEIHGLTVQELKGAIRSWVQSMGYKTSDLAQTSGFLSELADDVAKASSRIQEKLNAEAEA